MLSSITRLPTAPAAAGIARTGAYNRTLTPFGFQNEERTLWQAPDVYMRMSPFMWVPCGVSNR